MRCNAAGISQTSKAEDHSGAKSALQQICDDLPWTAFYDFCKRLNVSTIQHELLKKYFD